MPSKIIAAQHIGRRDIPEETGVMNLGIFKFRPAETFRFTPGQYVMLGTERDGKQIMRLYSIAHYATQPTHDLELFIGLVKKGGRGSDGRGLFTGTLFDDKNQSREYFLKSNASGEFAQGKFMLPADDRHAVLVGTSTGISPLVSMIRDNFGYSAGSYNASQCKGRRMTIVSGVAAQGDINAYHDEFMALERAEPRFQYIARSSRIKEDAVDVRGKRMEKGYVEECWMGERGQNKWLRVAPAEIDNVIAAKTSIDTLLGEEFKPSTHVLMVCGNPGMAGNMIKLAEKRGFVKGKDVLMESW